MEKEKGMAVGFINDRDKVDYPCTQLAFYESLVMPLWTPYVELFPQVGRK